MSDMNKKNSDLKLFFLLYKENIMFCFILLSVCYVCCHPVVDHEKF